MTKNIILNVDSYKASHFKQYPPGTQVVSSYIESRGGKFDKSLFFGLQIFIKDWLKTPITQENIDEAEEVFTAHGDPFNREGWEYILKVHKGYLPLIINAVPEGTVVPVKNALLEVRNTDPNVPWLTSYVETALLRAVWYPTTVATLSWNIKQVVIKALEKTAEKPMDSLGFMLNDFGSRGVSSYESSAIGGLAHLVNFSGTDNIPAIMAGRKYYGCTMAGYSIPAAEHSTITSWGKSNETEAYRNMLNQFKDGKILAVVSDSYDLENAVKNIWGKELKEEVINSGARVVIRPDSGDPCTMAISTVSWLMDAFGFSTNSKGFKVLPPYVRVIYGDGINLESIKEICEGFIHYKLSVENVCFGMGGGLLQQLDRDTMKFAMKTSAVMIDGVWRDVFKDPKTDPGKASKKGVQDLYLDATGNYVTDCAKNAYKYKSRVMRCVYYDGGDRVNDTLQQIRERSVL